MIQLAKGNYISRVWFLRKSGGGGGMDVLAHLWRRLPDGLWTLEYRFRYYEDQKTHGSQDRKSGYAGTYEASLEESIVVKKTEFALRALLDHMPGFVLDTVVVETDEPRVIANLLAQQPWMHLKIEPLPSEESGAERPFPSRAELQRLRERIYDTPGKAGKLPWSRRGGTPDGKGRG